MKFSILTLFVLSFSFHSAAGQEWMLADPFEHKFFIENKGQFNNRIPEQQGEILYSAMIGPLDVFFTPNGFVYRYDPMEYPETDPRGGKRRKHLNSIGQPKFFTMQWENSNPQVKVIAEEEKNGYVTYGSLSRPEGDFGSRARTFGRLIYKDVFPGIDAVFSFDKDRTGLKYEYIVHPDADPSMIRQVYPDATSLNVDEGNLSVQSVFGNFTDHSPVSYYSDNTSAPIVSSFRLAGNTIDYQLEEYDRSRILVIDPFVVNPPAFNGNRKAAYDIEYDLAGNIYVYGGRKPFQVIKYNKSGQQQWMYVTPFLTDYYGDFAVDGYSGSAYIVEGYRQGAAQIVKISNGGVQLALQNGSAQMDEMWRVQFNNCSRKAVIAGGGVSGNCQAATLDTTLATFTPVNVLGATTPLHDFSLMAIDNNNFAYLASCKSNNHPTAFNNVLVRTNGATLSPNTYMVPDNHQILEGASIYYTNAPFQTGGVNGMNGMAVSNKYVYTYDGSVVQRRNKLTGAFINSATLTPTPFICGGIAVDDCDNIFIGVEKQVIRFDTNFTQLANNVCPDTVYDVRLSFNGDLLACGKDFVKSLKMIGGPLLTCNNLSVTITQGPCGSGSALATATGGNPAYTYIWSPGGQTTSAVSGLPPGTYTVTVGDNSCIPKAVQDTVVISASSFTATVASTNASCLNNDGAATVTVSSGVSPFTYTWAPSGGNSSAATGLSAGNYSVTITDATGCVSVQTFSITIPNAPALTPTATPASCNGSANGSASVTVSGGNAPYTYAWSPAGGNAANASGLAAGNYTVTVTDANNCSMSQTITITQPTALAATASATPTGCGSGTGSASATASGGTGPYSYVWSNGATTTQISNLTSQIYSVTITDSKGCTTTAQASVTAPSAGTASVQILQPVSCFGGSNGVVSASITGGTGPFTYSWSNGGTSSQISNLSAQIYSVIITDANGCTATQSITLGQPTILAGTAFSNPTQCNASTGTAAVSASGGTAPYSYLWSNGANSALASNLSAQTYSVVVTDANGCTATNTVTVTQLGGPTANAGTDQTITIGGNVNISGAGGVGYSWSPGGTLTCTTCQNPTASPSVTTTYTLIVSDANGCTDSDVITVVVEPLSCKNIPNADVIFFPNAFSPNDDGENDELCLEGWDDCIKTAEIKIYSRWGELVYESDSKTFCWDGRDKFSRVLNSAVFVYSLHVVMVSGAEKQMKGNVSLVR